jgi:hypothetical protein
MPIRAPWPRGEHLRAGGIIPFGAQLAMCFALPLPHLTAVCLLARSLSNCGFGPGGLYYNGVAGIAFTHNLDDAFAIDFATFTRGIPLITGPMASPSSPCRTVLCWANVTPSQPATTATITG